jgi:hypothetical protein
LTTAEAASRSTDGLDDVVDAADRVTGQQAADLPQKPIGLLSGEPPLVQLLARPRPDDHDLVLVVRRGSHVDVEKAVLAFDERAQLEYLERSEQLIAPASARMENEQAADHWQEHLPVEQFVSIVPLAPLRRIVGIPHRAAENYGRRGVTGRIRNSSRGDRGG